MTNMRYEAPTTLNDAISLLSNATGDAWVLAGGTDLLVQLRAEMIEPELVVDIKRIPNLNTIVNDGGAFKIGAVTPCAIIDEDGPLKKAWPGVVEASELIGSTQIQGRASLGGNLCNASPAADTVPALTAAGATITIAGPNKEREIPVEDLCQGPGQTSLAQGEVVVSFNLPERPPRSGDAYLRFIPRTEMDIAVVGVGVNVTLDGDGTCIAARVALGAVAERVLLVEEAAATLIGTKMETQDLQNLSAAASAACRPIDDKRGTAEYRTKIAGVLARRAAIIANQRAGTA